MLILFRSVSPLTYSKSKKDVITIYAVGEIQLHSNLRANIDTSWILTSVRREASWNEIF